VLLNTQQCNITNLALLTGWHLARWSSG